MNDALVPAPGQVASPPYVREVLVAVLVNHQRANASGCACGWAVLGASHAKHVAGVYEEFFAAKFS